MSPLLVRVLGHDQGGVLNATPPRELPGRNSSITRDKSWCRRRELPCPDALIIAAGKSLALTGARPFPVTSGLFDTRAN